MIHRLPLLTNSFGSGPSPKLREPSSGHGSSHNFGGEHRLQRLAMRIGNRSGEWRRIGEYVSILTFFEICWRKRAALFCIKNIELKEKMLHIFSDHSQVSKTSLYLGMILFLISLIEASLWQWQIWQKGTKEESREPPLQQSFPSQALTHDTVAKIRMVHGSSSSTVESVGPRPQLESEYWNYMSAWYCLISGSIWSK